jgi:uncharacterized protein (TIGR03435 family)
MAYGYDPDKVLGGPSWLEANRYDVIARVPAETTSDTQKLMLQSLLADRFRLVVKQENKPLPTYALVVGKKLLIKESEGSGDTGCHPQSTGARGEQGTMQIMFANTNGQPLSLVLGPGGVIQYNCRNMTMDAFADGLRGMFGTNLGPNKVINDTGLKGAWNFDVKWSMGLIGPPGGNSDRVSVFEAMEKQLGLKLEKREIPTPVIVVEKVNEKPTDNPPGVAEAFPAIPLPTEFEVTDIKPADPGVGGMIRFGMQPNGRYTATNSSLHMLINRAFPNLNNDQIVGVPKFADTDRYDVMAKAALPPGAPASLDADAQAPMILSMLKERFKLEYHMEERPVPAYSLVAGKPKLKKADPESRAFCKFIQTPAGAPPASRVMQCQNATMAQFAERLQNAAPGMNSPIQDATGITGGWDFNLMFSMSRMGFALPGRAGGDAGPQANAIPSAADPVEGYTLFEAIEKTLGLKLELQKRPMPVVVIDHLEPKPTEN